jgi:hypothetical protein
MVDKVNIGALNQCVADYAKKNNIPRKIIDLNNNSKVDTYEAVKFYFNHLNVRRSCFSKAGLRNPISFFGHNAKEEAFARKERAKMRKFVHDVKSNIRSWGKAKHRRINNMLDLLWEMAGKVGGKGAEGRYGKVLALKRELKKYSQFDSKRPLPKRVIRRKVSRLLRRYRRRPQRAFDKLVRKAQRMLKGMPRYVKGTDHYYLRLAKSLARGMRKTWKDWKVTGIKDERSAMQASIAKQGKCTELTYKFYQLCVMAGIPKSKLGYLEATKNEKGKGFVDKKGKPTGHVTLVLRVPKTINSKGYYIIDPARLKVNNPNYKGSVHGVDGLYGGYFDNMGVILDRKGKLVDAILIARLATKFLPTRQVYKKYFNKIYRAFTSNLRTVSRKELRRLMSDVRKKFPKWQKGHREVAKMINSVK